MKRSALVANSGPPEICRTVEGSVENMFIVPASSGAALDVHSPLPPDRQKHLALVKEAETQARVEFVGRHIPIIDGQRHLPSARCVSGQQGTESDLPTESPPSSLRHDSQVRQI